MQLARKLRARGPGTDVQQVRSARLTGRSASKPPEGRRRRPSSRTGGDEGNDVDELPIGRRVAYWRGRRKMSQQVFADRLGKSKSWVDKVERGRTPAGQVLRALRDRRHPRRSTCNCCMGKDPERRTDALNCIDQVEVEEIRAALERYDSISAYFDARARARRRCRRCARRSTTPGSPTSTPDTGCSPAPCRSCCARPRRPTPAYQGEQARRGRAPARAGLPDRLLGAAQARRVRPGLARRRPLHRRSPSAPATRCSPASPPTGSATRCSRSAGPDRRWNSTSTSPTGSRPAA